MTPLPHKVDSLDDVPEGARPFYEEAEGGGFKLPVEGVEPAEAVSGLKSRMGKLQKERDALNTKLEGLKDVDPEEYRALKQKIKETEERTATEQGKLDDIRAAWKKDTDEKLGEKDRTIAEKDRQIEDLAIERDLRTQIAAAGVKDEFLDDAYRALKELKPEIKIVEGKPIGFFIDRTGVDGDQTIAEYVAAWAKTPAASKYMPPPKGGGGGTGLKGKGGAVNKKYSDMTVEEKAEYLEANYAAGKYAGTHT